MTVTQTSEIITRLSAAWNARDAEAVAALYAPDASRHEIAFPGQRLQGRGDIAEGVGAILHAWPDCHLEIGRIGHDEDRLVTFEWTFVGTQQNDYGPLPGNGSPVELNGVSVLEMQGQLISEERVYWDAATLMTAAGLLNL
jgi:steroid delta-isomerase-like uncharacterized protein